MKKLTAFVLALVMALGLLSGCGSSNSDSNTPSGDDASAAAKTKLVVATSPDFPPFESLEGGEVVGIEVDILKKVAEKKGPAAGISANPQKASARVNPQKASARNK